MSIFFNLWAGIGIFILGIGAIFPEKKWIFLIWLGWFLFFPAFGIPIFQKLQDKQDKMLEETKPSLKGS